VANASANRSSKPRSARARWHGWWAAEPSLRCPPRLSCTTSRIDRVPQVRWGTGASSGPKACLRAGELTVVAGSSHSLKALQQASPFLPSALCRPGAGVNRQASFGLAVGWRRAQRPPWAVKASGSSCDRSDCELSSGVPSRCGCVDSEHTNGGSRLQAMAVVAAHRHPARPRA